MGAVYKLVDNDQVSRVDVFPQGTTSRSGEHVRAALQSQRLHIGTVVDEGRHHVVPSTMSGRGRKRVEI